jgi:hypothetical protein
MSRTFRTLELASFTHSVIYAALLAAALGFAPLEPIKTTLGWSHGLMWIGMSLACLAALRARIITLRIAVAVVVIGGVGPFVGSVEFLRKAHSLKAELGRTSPATAER